MADRSSIVFADTSIAIALFVHSPETKLRIREQLSQHKLKWTSLVVRQEFKRRLLKEAYYLDRKLDQLGTYKRVHRDVATHLPPQWQRKRNICLDTLSTVDEMDNEQDKTDRLRLFLKYLLERGTVKFERFFDFIVEDSGSACGRQDVRKDLQGKYNFGPQRCSKVQGLCGIEQFLSSRKNQVMMIRDLIHKDGIGNVAKTREINNSEDFIECFLREPNNIQTRDPCLTTGDLIIALESARAGNFYTMNAKESQFFCRALNQGLIVRKKHPKHQDIVCDAVDEKWPIFS